MGSIQPIQVVPVTAGQILGAFAVQVALLLIAIGLTLMVFRPESRRDGCEACRDEPVRAPRRLRRRPPYTGAVHECPGLDETVELPAVDGDR